jgi:nucleoside-diphosphate-sugar epimerase
MREQTYLVTGGAGFIGSHIVEELVRQKKRVRVLDNFSSGKRENLAPFVNKIEVFEGDIRDFWTVIQAVKGVNYILHQAALPSIKRSVNNPLTSNEVNINGTLNLLEAARQEKVKCFVYASSSSVYGDLPELPKREDRRAQPLSPYAIAKLAGEEYCLVFNRIFGLPTVCLRYFNVFGPRQDPSSQYSAVIPKFISALLEKESPVIFGDGEQSRDFTFVENVVEANLLACIKPKAVGEVINIACNQSYTVNQLLEVLKQIIPVNLRPIYLKSEPGDIKHSLADITKAEKLLDYRVKIPFPEGLRKTVECFKHETHN